MAQNYVECPVCEATCPIEDDAKHGDEIFCYSCSMPLLLKKAGDGLRAVDES